MLIPLAMLSVGALLAGLLFKHDFIGEGAAEFWKGALFYASSNHIFAQMEEVPGLVSFIPTLMMAGGFLTAYYVYILAPGTAERWAETNRLLYQFLLNKWYFDELYNFIFVRPAMWIGRLFWKEGDVAIIDKLGPDGIAARVVDTTGRIVKIQTGYIYHYAFAMMLGLAAIISYYLVAGAH